MQTVLLWSDTAFQDRSALGSVLGKDVVILRPDIADLIAASYDPVLPPSSTDASHALRLFARLRPQ